MSAMGATKERGFGQPAGSGLSNLYAGIAARAETMEAYRICTKCGVDNFTQYPVRAGEQPAPLAP